MRHTRTGLLVALTAILVMSLAPAALAAEGEADLSGYGWLAAKGSGEATLDMGGRIESRINGDVSVTDIAGDARVWLKSANEQVFAAVRNPDITLDDFNGWVVVQGSHFVIKLEGDLKFRAHGHGFAHLEGTGVYVTRHGEIRTWSNGGTDIALEPTAA